MVQAVDDMLHARHWCACAVGLICCLFPCTANAITAVLRGEATEEPVMWPVLDVHVCVSQDNYVLDHVLGHVLMSKHVLGHDLGHIMTRLLCVLSVLPLLWHENE